MFQQTSDILYLFFLYAHLKGVLKLFERSWERQNIMRNGTEMTILVEKTAAVMASFNTVHSNPTSLIII